MGIVDAVECSRMLINIDKNFILLTAILSSLRLSFCKSWYHQKDLLQNGFNHYSGHELDLNKHKLDMCHVLNSCLPCLLGETSYLDCTRCPVVNHFVESVDILMFQVRNNILFNVHQHMDNSEF